MWGGFCIQLQEENIIRYAVLLHTILRSRKDIYIYTQLYIPLTNGISCQCSYRHTHLGYPAIGNSPIHSPPAQRTTLNHARRLDHPHPGPFSPFPSPPPLGLTIKNNGIGVPISLSSCVHRGLASSRVASIQNSFRKRKPFAAYVAFPSAVASTNVSTPISSALSRPHFMSLLPTPRRRCSGWT